MTSIDLSQIDPEALKGASRRDLIQLAKKLNQLKNKAGQVGPQTDDELHAFIKDKWGIHVPRIAVDIDRGHCAPFDMIADIYFERITAGLAVGGRESGKCVAAGSLITDANTGRRIPIEDVVAGERVLVGTLDQDSSIVYRYPTQTHDTGTSRCLNIKLASGRSVITTPEHPYLTETGWKRADELSVDGCVATPALAPLPFAPEVVDDELVDLLALIAAEGCTTGGRAAFSTADDRIIEIANKIADRYGCSVVKLTGRYDWAFKKQSGWRTSQIIDLLREHDLFGDLAKHKKIPPIAFRLDRKQLCRFLSVFWMCDGYVCDGDVGITLASQSMVEEIQHLLLRIGVQSRVAHRTSSNGSGRRFDAWRLTVYGNHVAKLNAELELWGEKRQRLQAAADVESVSRSGRPPLTPEITRLIASNMPPTARGDGAPQRTFEHLGWRSRPTASVDKVLTQGGVKTLQSRRLRALCHGRQIDESMFSRLLSEDIWWDYIVSIEDAGEHRVFDLTMEGTENYVVNDIVAHNTFNVAIVHALNARFKPGYEGISAGAVSEQSKRAYSALKKLNRTWGGSGAETKETDVESTLQSETVYTNGSIVSILGGTVAQLNGPHSNLLHRDEVELFRRDAFDEANNITRTGITNDGRPIKAIDILTSSLKYAKGLLQEILERVDTAIKEGNEPPYVVYKWGVAETIAPVPNCRHDPKNADLPEEDLCPCERHVNGVWGDGSPRTLASVCNGRFARSDGYRPLIPDILNKFQQNSRGVWEAQQECIRPAAEGLILENFTRDRHGIRNYIPDPENGLIFLSADFGGTNAHAANWYQLTNRMVACQNNDGGFFVIPANSLVAFDEVYVTEVGNVDFGEMVKASEAAWKEALPYFTVAERYADIAAKAARLDWRSIGLPTVWRITREIEEHISKCVVLVDNFRFYVDVDRCPMFVEEAEAWQRDPATGKQRDVFNHCVAGDTIVQTRQGLRLARDLDGEIVEVLTEGGEYRPAEWKSYGVRDVYEVEFDNGETIRATDGHQWIVTHRGGNERVTTLDLVGRTVPTQAASWKIENQFIYNEGVKNGLIYGDGTRGTINGHTYSWMNQYGDENCAIVEDYFIDRHSERKLSEHLGVKISTKTFPPHFKDLPPNDHPDYVRGFIAGLIAADGAVNKQGCCYISTSKKDDVNEIISLCRSVGVVVANVECYQPTESSYPNAKPNYRIWITKASLDETLLLKPSHRENGLRVGKYIKRYTRKVVAVRPAGREEVFCCEEPVTNSWTTGTGLITSNCMSNFRYAVANIDRREKIYNMRGSNDVAAASAKSKDRDHKLDIHQVPATGPASRDLREMPDTIPMHQGASAYDVRIW